MAGEENERAAIRWLPIIREITQLIGAVSAFIVAVIMLFGLGYFGKLGKIESGVDDIKKDLRDLSVDYSIVQHPQSLPPSWKRIYANGVIEAEKRGYIIMIGGKIVTADKWKNEMRFIPEKKREEIENIIIKPGYREKTTEELTNIIVRELGGSMWLYGIGKNVGEEISTYSQIAIVAGYINEILGK